MKKLRKAFVAGVMSITIISMSMLAVPFQVGAAATAGDLIKMDGLSSVYYLAGDGKRYVFPNEATYFSWYGDFSGIKTIPQAELESYPLGKNVTMRPGTKLVKITTNPKVYAVTPGGKLVAVPSETVASTLWGANWNKRIVDVPDAFFTNYTIESGEVAASAYPNGSLIKYSSSASVYYIESGKARKIVDEASFLANRFKWDDIVNAPDSVALPTAGADITAGVESIYDTSSGAGGTPGAGTGLTVAISGDTAPSRSVPSSSSLVPFATVNLTASNDGAVTVDQMIFTRKGTGDASEFDGGYLYAGDSILSTKRAVNTTDGTITFTALNLSVPAGTTKSVTLKMNADASVTGNHYFQLTSASDIKTNGAAVSGSFPISGNTMTYSSVSAGRVTIAGSAVDATYKIGETQVVVSEFNLTSSSTEDVSISRIRLRQEEDAGNNAASNYSLDLDGTVVKSSVTMVDKYVDFILDTPFVLAKSKTITATVRADIVTDIGKAIQLYLKEVTDFEARGSAYGDFYSAGVTNNFGVGTGGQIEIQGSEINISTDGPAATEYKDNTDDVVLANVKISAANEDVLFDTLRFGLNTLAKANGYTLQNIVLVDNANSASYSVDDPASSTSVSLDFENVYIKKGVQYNFKLMGDIQDNTPAGTTFYATLDTSTGQVAHFQDADETAITAGDYSSSGFTGKTMTVAAPAVTLSRVTTSAQTTVKDAKDVLLFKGKITANSVDNLTMSKLYINGTIGDLAANTFATDWQRVYLYKVNSDGSTRTKLDDETSLSLDYVSFTNFNLAIPKGLSNGVYVEVRGDVKSSPTGTTTEIAFEDTYTKYTVKDSDNNALGDSQFTAATDKGHVTTIATVGTFTLDMDTSETGVNANSNILAGGIVKVGRIKATAQKEIAVIEDLVIQNTGSATNETAARVYLYSDSAMTTLLGSADFADGGTPSALLEDINVEIPITGIKYLYVGVQVKGIDYSSSPSADATGAAGGTVIVSVPANNGSYVTKVNGRDTGTLIGNPTFNGTSMTYTVMGATMSAITSDFANGLLSNGIGKDIFSFKVTAPVSTNVDSDGSALGIKMATTTFTVATSSGITLTDFKVERVGGANGEKDGHYAVTTDSYVLGTGFTINFLDTYASTDSDLVIKPGETATYVVRATVAGVGSDASLQCTIEGLTSNAAYTHNIGSSGSRTGDANAVYPKLPSTSYVRGGTLTN